MKQIKKQTLFGKLLLVTLLILSSSLFISCDDDNNDKDDEQRQLYIGQLTQAKDGLEYLIDYSDYGYKQGQYPIESADLLTEDFDEITQLITEINKGYYNLSEIQVKVDNTIAKSNASIDAFKATKRISTLYDQDTIDKLSVLQDKKIELLNLRDNTTYGNYTGQYPLESKSILQTSIDDLARLISDIENFLIVNPLQSEIDAAINDADSVINEFNGTIRIVDNIIYNLYVDGNNGGYIDFGYSDDFVAFGAQGDQSFTVEMWVNINKYCSQTGEDNSTFLSTFIQKDGSGEFFSGWRLQSRTQNIIRSSIGVTDVDNNARHIWEPAFNFNKKDEWVHVAFVYSDKGLDGVSSRRSVIYCNGERQGDIIDISEVERQYNSQDAIASRVKMTAFGRLDLDGVTMKEFFSGYIKKMRMWKTPKDSPYIKASKDGTAIIDYNDSDLICAWDFDTKPADGVTLTDLTGRHTAIVRGAYEWVEAD